MSKTEKKQSKKSQVTSSRDRLAERVLKRFPNRRFETDDDVFDAIDEYDTFLSEHYESMLSDHNRLTQLMYSNPRVGAFITEVAEGGDALEACVRYFGQELLESSGDARRMYAVRKANDEFVERSRAYREMEQAMERNVDKSARAIERFMRNKQMNETELEDFIDRIFHVCKHVFAGDLSEDVLELLYKGLRYDTDLSCAEHAAEVKGRNQRILMERRDAVGDNLPKPQGRLAGAGASRRVPRRSVWDM